MNIYKHIFFFTSFLTLFGQENNTKKKEETEKLIKEIKKVKNKDKEKEKTFSTNEDVKKIIKMRDNLLKKEKESQKKIKIDTNVDKEEREKKSIKVPLRKAKNLTMEYKDMIIKANTNTKTRRLKKYIPVIKEISFIQPNLSDPLFFLKNIKYPSQKHFYDMNFRLFNIVWGINISSGVDMGFSIIKNNNIRNKTLYINLNFGYKYAKYGHIEFILGGTKIKRNNNKSIMPLWLGVTPINFDINIYRKKNSPFALNLNIQFILKTLLTENMKTCIGSLWKHDKNKIIPYMGDLSNPNFLNIFVDLKIYLGLKYINEI